MLIIILMWSTNKIPTCQMHEKKPLTQKRYFPIVMKILWIISLSSTLRNVLSIKSSKPGKQCRVQSVDNDMKKHWLIEISKWEDGQWHQDCLKKKKILKILIMKIILNAMIFVPLVGILQNNHYGHYYLVDSFPMTPKT